MKKRCVCNDGGFLSMLYGEDEMAEFYDIGGMLGTDWRGLSREQKQRWMRHAIGLGVTDFGEAREMFENRFKDGGGIHIDPKNKGKFNATKKRTGKSTEELTHSKNPLTRKRAVFAQNAAGWRHDDGGRLLVGGSPYLLSYGRSFVEEPGMMGGNGRRYTPFMYLGMEVPRVRGVEALVMEDAELADRQRRARLEWLSEMMPVEPEKVVNSVNPLRYNRGKLRSEIEALLREQLGWTEGNEYRLGREVRPRDVFKKRGIGSANSHHFSGNAVDLTSGSMSYEDILKAMVENEMVRRFFEENMLGIYDERTSRGSHKITGPHFHIGPDKVAVEDWNGFLRQYGYADGGPIGSWLKRKMRNVIDSEARNAPRYGKDKRFEEAFDDARKKGANTFYWGNDYFNTRFADGLSNSAKAEDVMNYFANNGRYPEYDWSDDLANGLYDALISESAITFRPQDIARVIGDESRFVKYAKGNGKKFVGPFQADADAFNRIYDVEHDGFSGDDIYGQYINKTRSDEDMIRDIIKYFAWMDGRITSERDKMGYGRIKVNQYAPNARLDDIVSRRVWDNNIIHEIKAGRIPDTLEQGVATYRDLMNGYNEYAENDPW